MTIQEFMERVEGVGSDGEKKAVCAVQILQAKGEDDAEVLREYVTPDSVVSFAIVPNGISMVDLEFDGATDYDFLQVAGVCDEYNERIRKIKSGDTVRPVLAVTVTAETDFERFLNLSDCAWCYTSTAAGEPTSGIRFIVGTSNIGYLELTKEQEDRLFSAMQTEEYDNE